MNENSPREAQLGSLLLRAGRKLGEKLEQVIRILISADRTTTGFPSMPQTFDSNETDFSSPPSHARRKFDINEERETKPMNTMSKKKFKINTMTPRYAPEELPEGMSIKNPENLSDFRTGSNFILQIENAAKKKLFEHIEWGKQTSKNTVEQGGILLGRVFKKSGRNNTYGVVKDVVPGKSAHGSAAYLELSTEAWKEMLDHVDSELERGVGGGNQIIGWYHTHPNSLDVFMSGTDMGTQRRLFSNDWHFALVLNPQRKLWRAFHGPDANECLGMWDSTTEKEFIKQPKENIEEPQVKRPELNYPEVVYTRPPQRVSRFPLRKLAIGLSSIVVIGVFFWLSGLSGNSEKKAKNQPPDNKAATAKALSQPKDQSPSPITPGSIDSSKIVLYEITLKPGNNFANFRSAPKIEDENKLFIIRPGDILPVLADDNTKWYKVRRKLTEGWVSKSFFVKIPSSPQE